ncbi:MAG TPA: hypothetical protein VEC57_10530 [Candidatus Limnocylindrales bacterium]|nr:hypothetical protein [Candidatus Limnocylindrales bacterium]
MILLIRASFLAFLAALALFCARNLDFKSDITNFMPDPESADLALLAGYMTRSDLARTMFLTVTTRARAHGGEGGDAAHGRGDAAQGGGDGDDDRIAVAVTGLGERLRGNSEVAWLRIAPEDQELEKVWSVYFSRRFGLISLAPEREIPALLSPQAVAAKAREAVEGLASPAGTLVKRTLPADPLGFFARILDRLRAESPTLEVRRGVFFSSDGWGVVMLATRHSSFDTAQQEPLLAEVAAAFEQVNAHAGGDLVLEMSAVSRYAIAAEQAMMADVPWIVGASTVSVAVLFLAFFRSLGRFLIATLPMLAGLLVPASLGLVLFGRIDGLTLGFGASLLGATIDYPTHLLNHLAMLGGTRGEAVSRVGVSISMGALTTMASFAGLGLTSFPGFREIAFFATVGVAAALATTLLVVPWFVSEHERPTLAAGASARVMGAAVAWLRRHRLALLAVPLAAVVAGAVMLPRTQWEDDLTSLGSFDPAMDVEEKRVRQRVSPFEMGRAVMMQAEDEEQALERTEEIARRLHRLREDGALDGFRTAADIVWSQQLQRRNIDAVGAVPDLPARVESAFASAGFRADAFTPFRSDLAAAPPPPLTVADLQGTGLDRLLAPMLFTLEGRSATISYIRGPRDEEAVRASIAEIPGARYFVQKDFVNELYRDFRDTSLQQILMGGVLVVLILLARYRAWRPALAAFLPSLLVPVFVLAAFAALGIPVNLLHVISLVMVMGMGTDFGVFIVDTRSDPRQFQATLVSLLLCCLTTVATFAVLGISTHPALRAIGLTTGLSVLLALVLAPVSLLLVEESDGADS